MLAKIRDLYVYPIKSAAGVRVETLEFTARGPAWDRNWMIVDRNGQFVTQRQFGRLAQIVPFQQNGVWFATLPNGQQLPLPAIHQGDLNQNVEPQERQVVVWRDQVRALDCGIKWNRAFQENFNQDWHLVEMKPSHERWLNNPLAPYRHPIGFADAEPILLVNENSVKDLEDRVQKPVGHVRFRPNIVIEGMPAFHEISTETWSTNNMEFIKTKLCSRCVIITLNPVTGSSEIPELLKELAKDQLIEGKIRFGVHIVCQNPLRDKTSFSLRIGDTFECLANEGHSSK